MGRPIDHLVLATRDLAATADLYRRLGFRVGLRNRHPWGTENHVVQLPGSFLELIGLGADFRPLEPSDPAAPFANGLATFLAEREGLAMLALRSADAPGDAAAFAELGIGTGRLLHFARSAEAPDGTRREVSFSLAFTSDPDLPRAGFFVCQQHRPENFWNPAVQHHANMARCIRSVTLTARDPQTHADVLGRLFGPAAVAAEPGGLRIDTGGGSVEILTAAKFAGRTGKAAACGIATEDGFAAATFGVESIEVLRTILAGNDIAFESDEISLVVPAVAGLMLIFEGVVKDLT